MPLMRMIQRMRVLLWRTGPRVLHYLAWNSSRLNYSHCWRASHATHWATTRQRWSWSRSAACSIWPYAGESWAARPRIYILETQAAAANERTTNADLRDHVDRLQLRVDTAQAKNVPHFFSSYCLPLYHYNKNVLIIIPSWKLKGYHCKRSNSHSKPYWPSSRPAATACECFCSKCM